MQELLRTGMSEGAVGMSSGLTYTPGMYADTAELVALCTVVAELGGFYAPHHRSYGAGALEAYAEMIDLARATGCALHLTHATMNFGVNKGRAGELLAMLDAGDRRRRATSPWTPTPTCRARPRCPRCCPAGRTSGGPDATLRPAARSGRPVNGSGRTSR